MSSLVVARYKGNEHTVSTWEDTASVGDIFGHLVVTVFPIVSQPEFKAVEMAKLIAAAAMGEDVRLPYRLTLTNPIENECGGVVCTVVDDAGTSVFTILSVKPMACLTPLFDKLNGDTSHAP